MDYFTKTVRKHVQCQVRQKKYCGIFLADHHAGNFLRVFAHLRNAGADASSRQESQGLQSKCGRSQQHKKTAVFPGFRPHNASFIPAIRLQPNMQQEQPGKSYPGARISGPTSASWRGRAIQPAWHGGANSCSAASCRCGLRKPESAEQPAPHERRLRTPRPANHAQNRITNTGQKGSWHTLQRKRGLPLPRQGGAEKDAANPDQFTLWTEAGNPDCPNRLSRQDAG